MKDAHKKKLEDMGGLGFFLYLVGRIYSKAGMHLIGKWEAKHGRINENRIVFKNRQFQDFSDNPRAFFEFLIKLGYNEKYEIIWMISNKKKYENFKYKNVKFVTAESRYGWDSWKAYYYGATAKYFFYTNNNANLNRFHCRGQITINLWHGCGYKAAAQDSWNKNGDTGMTKFDYALVPGPVFVKTKSEYWQCDKKKILPLGYPRYDWMLDSENNKEEILEKLFGWREKGVRVVIWMPTFRKSVLQGYGENGIELPYELPAVSGLEEMSKLDKFCRERKILLIIKKHPLQTGWSEKKQVYTNIFYVIEDRLEKENIQLYSLVGVCDGLLSDYSSIAVDFLLLDRPLGFVLTDYVEYKHKRGFVFHDPLRYMPGEKIFNFGDLLKYLGHVAEKSDIFREDRHKVMTEMHSTVENYCERIAEYFGIQR